MRRLIAFIVLALIGHNASALSFSPSTNPNTTGSFTVQFGSTPVGCYNPVDIYMDCYDLWVSADGWNSSGVVVSGRSYQDVTSWPMSNLTAGTYDFAIVHYVNAFPESYDFVDWGQMVVASQNVTFSITNATGAENGSVTFTVTKDGSTSQTTGVSWATVPDHAGTTATSGQDFTAASGTLSFAWNEASKTFTVYPLQDNIAEYTEVFGVSLSNATGPATIAINGAGGSITDDDPVPTISISDATIVEDGNLSYTLSLSNPAVYWVSASVAFGGTAASGTDYTAYAFGTVSVAPLATSGSLVLDTLQDSVFEGNETVNVTLTSYGGVPIGDGLGVGTITDDDTVTFSINDPSAIEGNPLAFVITQNGASALTHVLNYATGTAPTTPATAGSDYTAIGTTSLTFGPTGSATTQQTVNVTTIDEAPALVESVERVALNLAPNALNGATIGDNQGIGAINDDDTAFSIGDALITEGNSGNPTLTFTVSKSVNNGITNTVQWSTSTGGTATAGIDYTAVSGTLSFTSGQMSQTVSVTVTPDSMSEANETVNVTLTNPSANAALADASGVGTITNDDAPGPPINLTGPIGITTSSATITWTAASGVVTHHEVERTFDGAATTFNTGSSSTSYSSTGMSTNGAYRFRVRACNSAGGNFCSWWSNGHDVVRSTTDATTGVPALISGSSDAGPSTGLTNDFNGIVAGTASVDASGAANYAIPIAIPPGTRGMQPSLALVYSSHGSTSLVGRGWALTGASSAITRCEQTIAQDGAMRALNYTSSDRFCLEGQRLVLTTPGSLYGANNAHYRTELESFRDVVSNGGTSSSPNSFTVSTADGRTLSFGGTTGSNFQASGDNSAEIAAWLLRRVEDKFGNYFEITYLENEANGYYRPERIDYTGHSQTPVTSPYASVEFVYEALPAANIIRRFKAGSVTSIRDRLKRIVTKNGSSNVREYVLTYDSGESTPTPTAMSRLTSIVECAPTQASGACTAATSFDWVDEIGGMEAEQLMANPHAGSIQKWLDMNGDGRMDFVRLDITAQHVVALSTGTGFSANQTWTAAAPTANQDTEFADMDGDGDADFIVLGKPGAIQAVQSVYKSTGTGYSSVENWLGGDTASGRKFVDMNGDGRTDFVNWNNASSATDTINYRVSMSAGTDYDYANASNWQGPRLTGTPGWQPEAFDFHDVNSDGRADLVLMKGTTHRIYVNNGSGFDPYFEVTAASPSYSVWADLNGDGLLDFVQKATQTTNLVSLWTGKAYAHETWTTPFTLDPGYWRDVNGDGLADALGDSGQIGFSTGNGYVTAAAWSGFSGSAAGAEWVDIDGDGKPDFKSGTYPFNYQLNRSQPVHLMQKVTDGVGMETLFQYKPLTDSTVHTKLSNAAYPSMDVANAVHVVSRMRQSDGIGGYFDTDYRYTGFKADKSGRGSLGFASVIAEDVDRQTRTVTTYSQSFPKTGLPTDVDVYVTVASPFNQVVSATDIVYTERAGVTNYGGPAIKYVCTDTSTTVETDFETNLPLRTVLTDNSPGGSVPCDALGHPGQAGTADANGTPLKRSVTVTDHTANPIVVYRTDTETYFNDTFVAGISTLPTRVITKPYVDGGGDATKDRTVAIAYLAGNKGVVSTINREPDQSAPIRLLTTFTYDNFGNRVTETITPSEPPGTTPSQPQVRTETVQYDSAGRFPDVLTNTVGHVTDLAFDARFGTVLTIDGPNATNGANNDLITRTFDAFGRVKDERRPDASYEVVYYKKVEGAASGMAPNSKVMIETSVQNTAWGVAPTTRVTPVRTFLDGLGRELRVRSRAFDSTNFVHVDTTYDSRGRVEKISEPYYEGQAPTWTTPAYDALDRTVGITAADATQSTSTDYDAFTVTATDAGGRRNRLIADALGRTKRTENINAAGVTLAVTEFIFDKAGNITTVQKRTAGGSVIANTVIANTFDRLGRRVTTTDPDFGAGANGRVDFVYDSMGDLRQQQTPRLRAQSATLYTEFDYDRLARMTVRRDPSTSLTQTVTSTFTFDQSTAGCEWGVGRLTTEGISGGGEVGLTTTYCYAPAQFGRLSNEQRTTSSVTYRTDFTYDVLGRLSQVRYPATTTWPSASRYAVNYLYTPRGHLERVQEAQGSNTVLFQNVGANARGQIEKAYLGDGSRTTRSFVKNTERLAFTNAASGSSQVQNFAYGYDAVGNVSGRADLINSVSETFGYDALDRLTISTVTNGTGPHAVTVAYDDAAGNLGNMTHKSDISTLASASMSYSTTARPHAITTLNTGPATRTFAYNANGAITSGQVASTARTLAYTSYEMLSSATIGTTSRTFSYGPDRARYRQVAVSGGTTRTYTYIGEHYVSEVQGGATEHKLYIIANGAPVAYVSDDGTPETRYLHKDHLGSITTIVTNQNVAGREKLSYDAWGKRRSGTDWWSAAATASEERGYTGHEHLDDVTLIHMNGRAYDPQLARFTSPDPFVPAPLYSQSYNRYAYVYGNPLNFTDPSGFVPRDECSRFPINCGNTGPSFWPRLTLPYVPDDGFDWVDQSDWELYFQMQAIQDAQQQGPPATAPTTVDSPVKTDEQGVKPIVAASTATLLENKLQNEAFLDEYEDYLDEVQGFLEQIEELQHGSLAGADGRMRRTAVLMSQIEDLDYAMSCKVDACSADPVYPEFWVIGPKIGVKGLRARVSTPATVAVHGNSKLATGAQHVYQIMRTDAAGNTELFKYGISGGRINTAGLSARAQTQVSKLNKASGGQYTYSSQIVDRIPAGTGARAQALARERALVYQHRALTGAKPPGNIRP